MLSMHLRFRIELVDLHAMTIWQELSSGPLGEVPLLKSLFDDLKFHILDIRNFLICAASQIHVP